MDPDINSAAVYVSHDGWILVGLFLDSKLDQGLFWEASSLFTIYTGLYVIFVQWWCYEDFGVQVKGSSQQ